MADASYWSVHVSKSTGRQYWFNRKTNASVYEEPSELIAARAAAAAAPGGHAAHPHAAATAAASHGYSSHPGYAAAPAGHHGVPHGYAPYGHYGAAAAAAVAPVPAAASLPPPPAPVAAEPEHPAGLFSSNMLEFRRAVEEICTRIVRVKDALAAKAAAATAAGGSSNGTVDASGPGRPAAAAVGGRGWYRFPQAYDRFWRGAVEETAEEHGLRMHHGEDPDTGERTLYVFCDADKPPEVVAADALEAQLAAEAERLRAQEAAALLQARKEVEEKKARAAAASGGKAVSGAKRSRTAAGLTSLPAALMAAPGGAAAAAGGGASAAVDGSGPRDGTVAAAAGGAAAPPASSAVASLGLETKAVERKQRDRRTIAEIQEEMKQKRRKLVGEGGGEEADAVGPASGGGARAAPQGAGVAAPAADR